jgi:predicted house-cleaning noncanonical NTP pyrophosphatase (MazG superfamily)
MKMSDSYELVKMHRDVPIAAEDISAAGDTITKACRYYLIGKLAEQEKRNRNSDETNNRLLARIGKKVGYSAPRVSRACTYVKAIESLEKDAPDIVPLIIDGQSRLSIENTMNLSNKLPEEIREIIEKLSDETVRVNEVFPGRLSHRPESKENIKRKVKRKILATVKDIPEYDPDAQISSLTYTIPSWTGMVDKAFMNTDFTQVSAKALYKFRKELTVLTSTAEAILRVFEEEKQ